MLFFGVMDEGSSLLFGRNLANFLPKLAGGKNADTLSKPVDNEAISVRLSPHLLPRPKLIPWIYWNGRVKFQLSQIATKLTW